jgi:hypothetical protein
MGQNATRPRADHRCIFHFHFRTVFRAGRAVLLPHHTATRMLHLSPNAYAQFDTSPQIRFGDTSCEASKWIADTTIRCKMHQGKHHEWVVAALQLNLWSSPCKRASRASIVLLQELVVVSSSTFLFEHSSTSHGGCLGTSLKFQLCGPQNMLSSCLLSILRCFLVDFFLQVADDETQYPLSVSFPPGGRAAHTPLSNSVSASTLNAKERFILAVIRQDPEFLHSNAASARFDRFGTDMQLRAHARKQSSNSVLRNESIEVQN